MLSLIHIYFLTQERITLFGQQFHLADKDLNMDNSYVFALMTYGAVVFVLLMIAYFFTIRNLVKENRRKELAITLGFLIAGISEPFLFNTSFKNVSLIFVGSYLDVYKRQTYTYDLARLLVDMIETDKYGYYHVTNEGGYISLSLIHI